MGKYTGTLLIPSIAYCEDFFRLMLSDMSALSKVTFLLLRVEFRESSDAVVGSIRVRLYWPKAKVTENPI